MIPAPAAIPASGPSVSPAVSDDGLRADPQTGEQPSAAPEAGAAWGQPAPSGYGQPPAANGYGPPPGSPGFPPPDPGYGLPPGSPGYGSMPAPGYGYPPGYPGYGYVPVAKTNGLAMASLVCSLLWVFGLRAVLAIVFGFIARSQIKRSGGGQRGKGLALAGIIIGFVSVIAAVLSSWPRPPSTTTAIRTATARSTPSNTGT